MTTNIDKKQEQVQRSKSKSLVVEENIKLRIIVNELKRRLATFEAERKRRLMSTDEKGSLHDSGIKELQRIMSSENPEMEIAGLIGEREFYKERIRDIEGKLKEKDKEIISVNDMLQQKEADLALLENTVNSMGSERDRLYFEFEAERKAMDQSFSDKEELIRKSFVAIQLAKRKLINEKNLIQMKLEEINKKYVEREKQIRFLGTAIKRKEQELYKDYIEKEKKYTDQIEALKKEITILEARLVSSQREIRELAVKLEEFKVEEEDD